jgi:hypothetical protein
MQFFVIVRRVVLVRTDVSEERIRSMRRLLVTADVIPYTLVNLMMETLRSSETSVLTRATRRNIPEDAILHSHRRETRKAYIYATALCVSMFFCLCSLFALFALWHFSVNTPSHSYSRQSHRGLLHL